MRIPQHLGAMLFGDACTPVSRIRHQRTSGRAAPDRAQSRAATEVQPIEGDAPGLAVLKAQAARSAGQWL
ncbi:hypothetical protein DPM13_09470 [Paracoccus mutanolyticus]|uniref:Uncharacterized protein n=1 Tax=Paracoccus mutanolyticus TaxID=1499308 RepID=A0ABN5MBS0_9RHOB|nr:hypothetical protein DPM13_09470 [Paracoccus mutanolyticus]